MHLINCMQNIKWFPSSALKMCLPPLPAMNLLFRRACRVGLWKRRQHNLSKSLNFIDTFKMELSLIQGKYVYLMCSKHLQTFKQNTKMSKMHLSRGNDISYRKAEEDIISLIRRRNENVIHACSVASVVSSSLWHRRL